jgi:hypothetical protein
MTIVIKKWATGRDILGLLVEHGAEALLATPGIGAYADFLLVPPQYAPAAERSLYGDAAVWRAWLDLVARHEDRLRALDAAHRARVDRENSARVAASLPHGTGSMGEDWFDEKG